MLYAVNLVKNKISTVAMLSMVIACTLLYLDAAGTRDLSGVYKQRSQSLHPHFPYVVV